MKKMWWLSRISTTVLLTITFASLGRIVSVPSTPSLNTISSFIQAKGRIVYVDNWQIYVGDSSGAQAYCLTCNLNLTEATAPAWSPDAKYIAFKMLNAENSWAIAITDAHGS